MAGSDGRKLLVNLGSGVKGATWLPAMFGDWRELRVDINAEAAPDILADVTDLSSIESASVDAVWSAHCLEHLYLHEVGKAVGEAFRILADDGFFCMIVPDLQAIAEFLATDRLHDVVYQSPAGPITAHDMIYGYGASLARGNAAMAHRCGFTPTLMMQKLQEAPFAEIVLKRRTNHELAGIGCKRQATDDSDREAFLAALQL
jgi:SAM-dependent methyltransferase